jgi:hypothetical protein
MIAYSQRDPRWSSQQLGTGKLTVGQAGCLLCSAAAMLATWGTDIDPGRLNVHLISNHGYASGNLFVYAAVESFGCRFSELIRCHTTPAPVGRLREAIAAGAGVLACVDWTPGGVFQQHWVWLAELGELSGHVVDPWQYPGRELIGLDKYLAQGWKPARGIFAAAIYSRVPVLEGYEMGPDPELAGEHQDASCLRR